MKENLAKHINWSIGFCIMLIILFSQSSLAQVIVPFEPRTSTKAPNPYKDIKNYQIQGDFKMIGNTNLTLVNYSETENNNFPMRYVDADGDYRTLNSSSATLGFDGLEDCNEILYAGLYWSGRSHNAEDSPNTFSVTQNKIEEGGGSSISGQNVTGRHSETLLYTTYKVTISRQGNSGGYYPRYTFTSETRDNYDFEVTNSRDNDTRVKYRINEGSWRDLPISAYKEGLPSGTNMDAVLATPFEIVDGGVIIKIDFFRRLKSTSGSVENYQQNGRAFGSYEGNRNVTHVITANFDKKKVKLKKAGNEYVEITATDEEIYYPEPRDLHGNMFSAYADVTDYVRRNGVGEYFVADMALNEGNGGATGFYGGWGMVVVYKNPTLKWRDITVFDGHAFVASGNLSYELPVSGFRATQRGDVNVTLGLMAGEGDVGITGDYFHIRNVDDTSWVPLEHNNNSVNNFFNSSIVTGGNARNPNLRNNTGIDIAKFDLDNKQKQLIRNNQRETKFRYGTTGDTYVIYNLVLAVDAFIPEIIIENIPITNDVSNGAIVQPGTEIEFGVTVKNAGDESAREGKVELTLPWTVHFIESSDPTVTWIAPEGAIEGATPDNTTGGKLVWVIDDVYQTNNHEEIQKEMTYKIRVTDDCNLLLTSSCGIAEVAIEGKFTGITGIDMPVSSELVTGFNNVCQAPIYGTYKNSINIDNLSCTGNIEDSRMVFTVFCDGSFVPRDEVISQYPVGTKYYDAVGKEVTGDFSVSGSYNIGRTYSAVLPGMERNCSLSFVTFKRKVETTPANVEDLSFCRNVQIDLGYQVSDKGQTQGLSLLYFNSEESLTPISDFTLPTTAGVYTFYVAEGRRVNDLLCIGDKLEFKVTVLEIPSFIDDFNDFYVCIDKDKTVVVSSNDNLPIDRWEFWNAELDEWTVLTNISFQSELSIEENKLIVTDATLKIDSLKVRAVIKNENGCEALSNEGIIEVRYCSIPVNPMIQVK